MNNTKWSSTTRLVVVLTLLIGFIVLVIWAFPLVEALSITALLAYLLDPLVKLVMRKLRMKRFWAVIIVYVLLLVILVSIPATFGTIAYGQFERWSADLQSAVDEIEKFLSQPVIFFGLGFSPGSVIQQLSQSAGSALTSVSGNTFSIVSGITTNILWGLLVLVSLYYFLQDGSEIKPWLVKLAPDAYQKDVDRLLDEINRVWGVFLRVQLLIFLVLFILFILGSLLVIWLYQLGLIPFSTLGFVVTLILVYAAVQQVDNLWLRPQLMGSQLRLHPAIVFVGLVGALALGGVLLALVVVPLIASAKVIGRYVRLKLLDLPPWPEETTDEQLPSQNQINETDKESVT